MTGIQLSSADHPRIRGWEVRVMAKLKKQSIRAALNVKSYKKKEEEDEEGKLATEQQRFFFFST